MSGSFCNRIFSEVAVVSLYVVIAESSYGLQQHVASPTYKHDHTLDLIITRQSDQFLENTLLISRYISDHATVVCSIRCDKPPLSGGQFPIENCNQST